MSEYAPHQTLPQNVYFWLRGLIESGEFALGERLDEVSLAARRGVSRTPLREAIRQLAAEGAVEHRPYSGNYIREFTASQVEDLYEYRKALEALAIRQVVKRRQSSEFAPLRAIIERCHAALDDGDLVESEAEDRRFHAWIAQHSGNEMVVRSLEGLGLQIQLLRSVANRAEPFRDTSKTHRLGIIAALVRGDGDEAAELMGEHIAAVQQAAVSMLLDATNG